jgi:hypothetical protein
MRNDRSATARIWPKKLSHQAIRRSAGRAILLVLLAVSAAIGLGSPAAADSAPLVKVFVVPDNGQTITLSLVAQATLGDQARAGEIFELNRGQAQPDGVALTDPGEQLRPGWILRLPQDATGANVQQARDTAAPAGGTAAGDAAATSSTLMTIPLPAAAAVVGAILLALITAGIVGRKRVRGWFAAWRRLVHKLGDPARRRRRLEQRQALGQAFATDGESVRRAYRALEDFAATADRPEKPVHAVRVDADGVTVWLTQSDVALSPWVNLEGTSWRRPVGTPEERGRPGSSVAEQVGLEACLVRAGTDGDGEPVFVDLSRLDGILSVTGDPAVSRQVVQNLLAEIGRSRPQTMVTVLGATDGPTALTVPPGLTRIVRAADGVVARPPAARRSSVRGVAARQRVQGLAVLAGAPDQRERAELAALCGPSGAGWTGLVCGEVDGAHWRWHADADGTLEIPVLRATLTAPA